MPENSITRRDALAIIGASVAGFATIIAIPKCNVWPKRRFVYQD